MTALLTRLFIKNRDDLKDPAVRAAYGRLAGVVGIVCNILLSAAKMLTGLILSSVAILSDGLNNLADATSSVVTLIGFKLAERPADKDHPFGHARYEYLAGLVVAFLILLVGYELGTSSFEKILHPEPVEFSLVSILILVLAIFVKLWMSMFNRRIGRLIDSAALEATAVDSRNDVFSTAAVLACVLVSRFTGLMLDGWVGLGMAVFILFSGVKMIKETLDPILGATPSEELVGDITRRVRDYEGVLGTHDLVIHDYGPGRCFASIHAEMDASEDILKSHDITDQIERDFLKEGIHLVVHLDPLITNDEELNEYRRMTAKLVASLDLGLTIHDFRMVKGYSHTNLIFDAVLPFECRTSETEVEELIRRKIHDADQKLFAVVNVERSFIG